MFCPHVGIIAVMTTLTQGTEIGWGTIFYHLVHVRYGEDYICHLSCLLVHSVGMVFYAAHFATISCTFQYLLPYLLPVLGIAALVLRLDRHVHEVN